MPCLQTKITYPSSPLPSLCLSYPSPPRFHWLSFPLSCVCVCCLLLSSTFHLLWSKSSCVKCTLTVAISMDVVASSMMRMLLFLTKALARQNSCLWPWLKFSPPSVTMASRGKQHITYWNMVYKYIVKHHLCLCLHYLNIVIFCYIIWSLTLNGNFSRTGLFYVTWEQSFRVLKL